MKLFEKIINGLCNIGSYLGNISLAAILTITVASVIFRTFGKLFPGSYELTETIITIFVGFALAYTALKQGHITVGIVTSRFPKRVLSITKTCMLAIATVTPGLMAFTAGSFVFENGFGGEGTTRLLKIPFFPLKVFWVLALLLCSLAFLVQFYKSLTQRET